MPTEEKKKKIGKETEEKQLLPLLTPLLLLLRPRTVPLNDFWLVRLDFLGLVYLSGPSYFDEILPYVNEAGSTSCYYCVQSTPHSRLVRGEKDSGRPWIFLYLFLWLGVSRGGVSFFFKRNKEERDRRRDYGHLHSTDLIRIMTAHKKETTNYSRG